MNRRILGPLLSVILILGVGAAIFLSARDQLAARRVVTVTGLIGSEKEEFFRDPRVVAVLRDNGIAVEFEKAGSRQIATSYDLSKYDFAFPAGVPSAEKVRREAGVNKSYEPFFTPMVIASWQPIAEILVANGIATSQNGYYTLDMGKLLQLIHDGKRWTDLAANDAYPVNKSILVTSTDVRKSNSGAMYLALASYVLNGNNIVQTDAEVAQLSTQLETLFLAQGFTEYSSEVPFEDYLMIGMGKAPLVMIYEAQFIAQAAAANSPITSEMVLLYPQPTIFTKHNLVALTPNGEKLGEVLTMNEELQKLAIEYGLRNRNTAYLQEFIDKHQLQLPPNLIDVIEPPSYEILEKMIAYIEKRYAEELPNAAGAVTQAVDEEGIDPDALRSSSPAASSATSAASLSTWNNVANGISNNVVTIVASVIAAVGAVVAAVIPGFWNKRT